MAIPPRHSYNPNGLLQNVPRGLAPAARAVASFMTGFLALNTVGEPQPVHLLGVQSGDVEPDLSPDGRSRSAAEPCAPSPAASTTWRPSSPLRLTTTPGTKRRAAAAAPAATRTTVAGGRPWIRSHSQHAPLLQVWVRGPDVEALGVRQAERQRHRVKVVELRTALGAGVEVSVEANVTRRVGQPQRPSGERAPPLPAPGSAHNPAPSFQPSSSS